MGDNNCSRVLLYGDARAGAGSLAKKNKRGECVGAHHDCPLWPSVDNTNHRILRLATTATTVTVVGAVGGKEPRLHGVAPCPGEVELLRGGAEGGSDPLEEALVGVRHLVRSRRAGRGNTEDVRRACRGIRCCYRTCTN